MGRRVKKYMIALSVPAIFLFGQCAPKVGNGVLNFFFDGVPEIDSSQLTVADTEPGLQDSLSMTMATGPETISGPLIHYPYLERECAICHDERSLGSMILPEPELCYQCHEDFSNTYKYVHGPVAGGYCTACHDPHQSEEKSLLRLTGQSLCLNCHNPESVFQNEMHADLGKTNCTECHNPHGGEDRFIFY